jgi:hypothetical protein
MKVEHKPKNVKNNPKKKIKVEQYLSEMFHKLGVLRFFFKDLMFLNLIIWWFMSLILWMIVETFMMTQQWYKS